MKPLLFLIFVLPLLLVPITSQANNTTTTGTCDSGMSGIECRKIVIVTNYQDDNNHEWKKARVSFQFRSTNGKSCTVHGKLRKAENIRMVYNTSYLNNPCEWTKPGLVIEQIRKGIWPHSINWRISCKTLSFEN